MMNQITSEYIHRYLISHRNTSGPLERTIHLHPNAYEVMLFKSGNVDYFINDASYHLQPGDLTLVRPNDMHGYFVHDNLPYERMPVHFSETFIASLSTDQTDLSSCFTAPSSHLLHLAPEQCIQFESCVDSSIQYIDKNIFGCDVWIRANLSIILLLANSARQQEDASVNDNLPKVIQEAIYYINANFSNDISIQSIAEHLNISRSRLCHVFKDHIGISLWNYVIARRIQQAQLLLKQGTSITTACFESGFQNYAHFIKLFGKFTGTTPGKYVKFQEDLENTNPRVKSS